MRLVLALVGAALLVFLLMSSDRRLTRELQRTADTAELVYAPPSRFLQLISLRYQNVLADVLWFRTISYFGEHYKLDRAYPWLSHMCDRVTDLDPYNDYVYRFGGLILPWEAELVDEGIALLKKGARNLPQSWEMPYMLGFTYYFFKDDLRAAGQAFRHALTLPDAPPFLTEMVAVVDAAEHGPQTAVVFLQSLSRNAATPEVRDAMQQRIRDLWLTEDIVELQAAADRFQAETGQAPGDITDLLLYGYVAYLPPDPFGGRYMIVTANNTVISTSGRRPKILGRSSARDAILQKQEREAQP